MAFLLMEMANPLMETAKSVMEMAFPTLETANPLMEMAKSIMEMTNPVLITTGILFSPIILKYICFF